MLTEAARPDEVYEPTKRVFEPVHGVDYRLTYNDYARRWIIMKPVEWIHGSHWQAVGSRTDRERAEMVAVLMCKEEK